jgi:hypothetical protein
MSTEQHTIATSIQVNDIADSNIDDSQDPLVFFLEPFLIKDPDCKHAVLGHSPFAVLGSCALM